MLLQYNIFLSLAGYKNQLHVVFRTQQGRRREPRVKILRSPSVLRRILEALRVERRNSTPRFALTTERKNENIKLNKHLIPSSWDRTNNQSRLQSRFVPLRHYWPHVEYNY